MITLPALCDLLRDHRRSRSVTAYGTTRTVSLIGRDRLMLTTINPVAWGKSVSVRGENYASDPADLIARTVLHGCR